jgi:hypothetical protein
MKRTAKRVRRPEAATLRDEYSFDYSKAKPNRFAAEMKRPVVAVILEPDVAAVFGSSASVNAQLRSAIADRRRKKASSRVRRSRRRVS